MARNFKRVVHNISYRHLGHDAYHAGFLFQQGVVAGRKKLWRGEIWAFSLVGRAWHDVFPPTAVVESCHVVRERGDSRALIYSGKDEVRAQLLKHAFQLREDRAVSLPGFELLWRSTIRGTTSEAGLQIKTVSTSLECEPAFAASFNRRYEDCTRCPECGQTTCNPECPGLQ